MPGPLAAHAYIVNDTRSVLVIITGIFLVSLQDVPYSLVGAFTADGFNVTQSHVDAVLRVSDRDGGRAASCVVLLNEGK